MLEYQTLLVIFAISFPVAAVTFLFVARTEKSRPTAPPDSDQPIRFLYDGTDLLDASDGGERLLEPSAGTSGDWENLARSLTPRFPDFPATPPDGQGAQPVRLNSADVGERSQVVIENIQGLTRVSLIEHRGAKAPNAADLHRYRVQSAMIDTLRKAASDAPYPIWKSDAQGRSLWTNSAYDQLIDACRDGGAEAPLFDLVESRPDAPSRSRVSVRLKDGAEQLWYDVTSVRTGDFTMHYAMDVNAVVQAQAARKNFVQTLTKTFAQLSIGLAIFNRKRELALFNPALTDLTGLPVGFLSNRPNLHSFFDRLRDNQTMPEPKNYASWRDKMDDLIDAATDGRYMETWNLTSGLTYRVSGRPHPDGAVAFLFEDVSAEMSLTRRFRADLELNQSVLNHLDRAVVVFSSGGQLYFCNDLYRDIWNTDPDHGCAEVSIHDALRLWQDASLPSDRWDEIGRFVISAAPGRDRGGVVRLRDGTRLNTRAIRVRGGASMVVFDYASPAKGRIRIVESA